MSRAYSLRVGFQAGAAVVTAFGADRGIEADAMRGSRMLVRAASSTVAIGVATVFIALAALLSFVDGPFDSFAGWRLRGTINPSAAAAGAERLPAGPKGA